MRKIDEQEYIVAFLDKNSLETFSKFADLDTALFGIRVKIEKLNIDPAGSSSLETVWIKIYNVPDVARDVDTIKEFTTFSSVYGNMSKKLDT